MIDPKSILIAIPAHDGRVECAIAGSLLALGAAHLCGNIVFLAGCSDIALARNLIANRFARESQFDWLMFIDSDITFSVDDFRLMITSTGDPSGCTLTRDGDCWIVTAPYARKGVNETVHFGLGFTLIHRDVFAALDAAVDAENTPRVGQFTHQGQLYSHYFPAGPGFEGRWFGEDLGFFHLCALVGVRPRVETRTRLGHVGRWNFPYPPPADPLEPADSAPGT